MFVDDMSGRGLWPGLSFGRPPVPLTPELLAEVDEWVDEWTRNFQDPAFDEEAHDWRGHALSLRLQDHLGPAYVIEFNPQSTAVEEALKRTTT